ncbi:MAG TPA: hypothetical protein DHU55_09935 [Blastocatellia bacterium]|nr:hypothetical protein [Blastocatellia bacterium]HAF25358.1 hypothetical protein [Blastocatellia bacterium]HCX30072.1 hypothetical protein [Blastocatellia bacterium]
MFIVSAGLFACGELLLAQTNSFRYKDLKIRIDFGRARVRFRAPFVMLRHRPMSNVQSPTSGRMTWHIGL